MTGVAGVVATFGLKVVTPPKYTLTVSKLGAGTVTSNPLGINCGSDCTESYDYNTPVTLNAIPASGSVFSGWSGACTGTGSCVVTMSAAKSATATFATNLKKGKKPN